MRESSEMPGGRVHRGRDVQVLTLPQLEHQQLPEPQGVIPSAGEVLVHQPINEGGLEIAALAGSRGLEYVRKDVSQAAPEPDAKRDPKPLLPAVRDPRRQQRADGLLEDVLTTPVG